MRADAMILGAVDSAHLSRTTCAAAPRVRLTCVTTAASPSVNPRSRPASLPCLTPTAQPLASPHLPPPPTHSPSSSARNSSYTARLLSSCTTLFPARASISSMKRKEGA